MAVRHGAGACAGAAQGSRPQAACQARVVLTTGAWRSRQDGQLDTACLHPGGRSATAGAAAQGQGQQRKGRRRSVRAGAAAQGNIHKGQRKTRGCPRCSHDVEEAQHHRGHKVHLRNVIQTGRQVAGRCAHGQAGCTQAGSWLGSDPVPVRTKHAAARLLPVAASEGQSCQATAMSGDSQVPHHKIQPPCSPPTAHVLAQRVKNKKTNLP